MADDQAFAAALQRGPSLVWIETPSNPLLRITDVAARAQEAHAAGALVVADNTLLTPLRQKPLELGCDLVMHSITKALNGHSDLFGGALLAREPALVERIQWWANAAGLNGSAFDSWQTLRGMRTLELRIAQQEKSAAALAEWLITRAEVLGVNYPGLVSHPDHNLAGRQQAGPGFMISFRLNGGREESAAFLAGLRLVTLASSLGGFSTLICQPATMTHRGMPEEAQEKAGIHRNLLRLSVGLEDVRDLIADLQCGFDAVVAISIAERDEPT
jgi:cystathionine gamma-synthase